MQREMGGDAVPFRQSKAGAGVRTRPVDGRKCRPASFWNVNYKCLPLWALAFVSSILSVVHGERSKGSEAAIYPAHGRMDRWLPSILYTVIGTIGSVGHLKITSCSVYAYSWYTNARPCLDESHARAQTGGGTARPRRDPAGAGRAARARAGRRLRRAGTGWRAQCAYGKQRSQAPLAQLRGMMVLWEGSLCTALSRVTETIDGTSHRFRVASENCLEEGDGVGDQPTWPCTCLAREPAAEIRLASVDTGREHRHWRRQH
jgi:hypothetical protein